MAINSRQKGKRGERELAAFLREHGYEARRGQQYSGDPSAPDVVGFDERFHVEVKRAEKVTLDSWMAQACADCGVKAPIVIHRRNRGQWLATMKLDDLIRLFLRAK